MERSPKGILSWVFVTGQGKENYNKDGYIYTANLSLDTDSEQCENLVNKIKESFKDTFGSKSKPKSLGYREEDGKTIFNFKTGAAFKDGTPTKIIIYNKNGTQIDLGETKVGNGSEGAIFFDIGTYTNGASKGVSLYLKAIQITKLLEYSTLPIEAEPLDGEFTNTTESVEPLLEVEGI